tara:strand:- start:1425 stop:2231 length:807 start_codon:yes stop_codon:yes gene_type:complete
MTGELNFKIFSNDTNVAKNFSIPVNNFLTESAQQEDPISALGISTQMKMLPIIGSIVVDGAADNGGLLKNDRITSINNIVISYASDIPKALNSLDSNFADIQLLRDEDTQIIPVKLLSVFDDQGNESKLLGIGFGLKRSIFASVLKGAQETYNLSVKTLQFIGKMFTGNMGTENLSGPIGIAKMAGDTAQAGLLPFFYLMALLSISLGVLNLLPIPGLDGGQLTLLGVEAVRGSPLPDKVENFIYATGMVMILCLMIFAVFNDVSRFI